MHKFYVLFVGADGDHPLSFLHRGVDGRLVKDQVLAMYNQCQILSSHHYSRRYSLSLDLIRDATSATSAPIIVPSPTPSSMISRHN